MKKRVMIFCDFYLPSYKSGGGMWTLVNLVDRFCDRYDFYIVTRNYDSKGDKKPYQTVKSDQWNTTGNAKVFYFSTKNFNQRKFAELVNEIKPDAFFLNSAFATPVVKFLAARKKRLFADAPVILAPCGEFSRGALSLKPLKKKLFLQYAKTVGLYENIIWKASFEEEKEEVKEVIGGRSEVFVAPDLVPKKILPDFSADWKPLKETGAVKFVFISRLVRKKNIHYFLERLREIKTGKVEFDIVGPLDDQEYWRECEAIIKSLPANVNVTATGAFPSQTDALRRVSANHFFAMPTLNENFGYVFIEALAAGCPLLISDRTVWDDIESHNSGWRIPLEAPERWIEQINRCLAMGDAEYAEMSRAARQYSVEWLAEPATNEATAKVLERALNGKARTVDAKR
jgi:glycosyltransferase involved in cell wall biosynthesis